MAYAVRSEPGTKAGIEASKKSKADALGKAAAKRVKTAPKGKTGPVKLIPAKGKPSLKRTSDAELGLAKPMRPTKKFAFSN
jgi:hypothetical protein